MNKRMFAILALVLFLAGLVVFMVSIAKGTNDYTFYAVVLCAPGAMMAFLNYMGQKRAQAQIAQEEHNDETAE